MVPGDEERPVLGPDPACSALDPRLLTGQDQATGLGAAIDVGARVLGVVQDVQDTAMAQRSPDQLTVAATSPEPGGALEVMVGEVLDDGQGGSRLLEQVEDQPDGLLDLFVGVEDDPALRISRPAPWAAGTGVGPGRPSSACRPGGGTGASGVRPRSWFRGIPGEDGRRMEWGHRPRPRR